MGDVYFTRGRVYGTADQMMKRIDALEAEISTLYKCKTLPPIYDQVSTVYGVPLDEIYNMIVKNGQGE